MSLNLQEVSLPRQMDRIFHCILFLFCPNHYSKLAHSGSLCSYQTTS